MPFCIIVVLHSNAQLKQVQSFVIQALAASILIAQLPFVTTQGQYP